MQILRYLSQYWASLVCLFCFSPERKNRTWNIFLLHLLSEVQSAKFFVVIKKSFSLGKTYHFVLDTVALKVKDNITAARKGFSHCRTPTCIRQQSDHMIYWVLTQRVMIVSPLSLHSDYYTSYSQKPSKEECLYSSPAHCGWAGNNCKSRMAAFVRVDSGDWILMGQSSQSSAQFWTLSTGHAQPHCQV